MESKPTFLREPFLSFSEMRAMHNDLQAARDLSRDPQVTLDSIEAFIISGEQTGTLLDDDDDRQAAQGLLTYWANALYRAGRTPPNSILADYDKTLAPLLDDSLCPYLGLDTFDETHQDVFFGRKEMVQTGINWLKDNRLLAVVGSSGSGKSSLVRAGIIPALRAGALPESKTWSYLPTLMPGSDPLGNLARAAQPEQNSLAAPLDLSLASKLMFAADGFRSDQDYLANLLTAINPAPAVLVIDQFEELFTLVEDENLRQSFVNQLMGMVNASSAAHRVIITLRSDFENQLARLPDFQTLFEKSRLQVTPMSAAELRSAIEQPAERVGLKFDEGVVDALLKDIVGEPAALPLLQFTLLKLWEHRDHNRITWTIYQQVGGGLGALSRAADEFYNGLIPEDQITAQRILLRLARPTQALEVTRNRIPREALYLTGEARDRVDRVLDRLIEARLVRQTFSQQPASHTAGAEGIDAQVEIAHEALIRNWPRLVDWLADAREIMRKRLRLTTAAEQWRDKGRDHSALLRGTLLSDALQYDDLDGIEKEYIAASVEAAEQAVRAQDAVRERELQQARDLAAEQERRAESERLRAEVERRRADEHDQARRWLTALVIALVVVGAIAIVAAITATRQARLATSRQHVAQALNRLDSQLDLSLLLSMEALNADYTFEAQSSLLSGLQLTSQQVRALLSGHEDNTWGVAFSPDGKTLVTTDEDGTVLFWDTTRLQPISRPVRHSEAGAYSVAYSADGRLVAVGYGDGEIRLWDATTREEIAEPLKPNSGAVFSLAFNPQNPRQLASGSANGPITLWEFDTWHNEVLTKTVLYGHRNWVWSLAYSADGKTLASGTRDPSITLWDMTSSAFISRTLNATDGINAIVVNVAFSPVEDAALLASSDAGGKITLWDTRPWNTPEHSKPKRIRNVTHGDGVIWGLAFSPNGRLLVSSGQDRLVRVWNVSGAIGEYRLTLSEPPLRGHADRVLRMAFSHDGKTFASGSNDNNVIVWDSTASHAFAGQKSPIVAVSFSLNAAELHAIGTDGAALAWNIGTHAALSETLPALDWLNGDASRHATANGSLLAWIAEDGAAVIWDVRAGKAISTPFDAATSLPESIALSADGRYAAVGLNSGNLMLWQIEPSVIKTLPAHMSAVTSIAFSPDGTRLVTGSCAEIRNERCAQSAIGVWSLDTRGGLDLRGEPFAVSEGDTVTTLAFGAHNTLAWGTRDGMAGLWDMAERKPIGIKLEDKARLSITSMAFSPDGATLAVGSQSSRDGTVKLALWNLQEQRRLADALLGHTDRITSLAYSADSRLLASGGADGYVFLWDGRIDKLLARACAIANRNMTLEEWQRYMGDDVTYRKTCPGLP